MRSQVDHGRIEILIEYTVTEIHACLCLQDNHSSNLAAELSCAASMTELLVNTE